MAFIYRGIIKVADKFVPKPLVPFWNHPAGPKTIFFWAPTMKWLMVLAGLGDLARPVEKVSKYQSFALACTGTIWSRYAMVIIPKNYNLLCVNMFVSTTGWYQIYRVLMYEQSLKEKEEEASKRVTSGTGTPE